MEAMLIRLEDNGEDVIVTTETSATLKSRNFTWGRGRGEVDGYPEMADEVRNYLLGTIADINWRKVLERL